MGDMGRYWQMWTDNGQKLTPSNGYVSCPGLLDNPNPTKGHHTPTIPWPGDPSTLLRPRYRLYNYEHTVFSPSIPLSLGEHRRLRFISFLQPHSHPNPQGRHSSCLTHGSWGDEHPYLLGSGQSPVQPSFRLAQCSDWKNLEGTVTSSHTWHLETWHSCGFYFPRNPSNPVISTL